MSMRTARTERRYKLARVRGELVPLASEQQISSAPRFMFWKIVNNRFPHDKHHNKHDLIVLRRDCDLTKLTAVELNELWFQVIPWADLHYDYVKLNLSTLRTVAATPHLHLLGLKKQYK